MADLRDWLADRLMRLQHGARVHGDSIPARLSPDAPVFDVPTRLLKILNRDLAGESTALVVLRPRVTIDRLFRRIPTPSL